MNIFVDSRLYLNDGDLETSIPGFEKKDNKNIITTHLPSDLEDKVYECYEFARKFCIDITQKVYETLEVLPHLYTENRYHSVDVKIQLPNQNEDIERIIEVYIKTDKKIEQGDKFYFLLSKDDEGKISLNNSIYKSIIIKDFDDKVIGMLIADDSNILDDCVDKAIIFQYHSYTANIDDYDSVLIDHMLNTEKVIGGYGNTTIIGVPNGK